jgi:uncharacterized DUF497 family protein
VIFEWNEDKRRRNLLKHGFDFADAAAVFACDMLTVADDRFDYELRTRGIGLLEGAVVTIIFVETGVTIRIISLRKANKGEQETYFERFGDRLEAD